MEDLVKILAAAIIEHRDAINSTARQWPDRPITIELSWNPKMHHVALVIKAIDHLPPYRFLDDGTS